MSKHVLEQLEALRIEAPQVYQNISICPLTCETHRYITYTVLSDALAANTLKVTEVSSDGSVPELKVTNTSTSRVLLLDGEELAGAKQNRVLNTSVLVPCKRSIVIPVSCTEQGRWAEETATFYDSGNVMAHNIRRKKARAVSESLAGGDSYAADQCEVWNEIAHLETAAAAPPSPTGAMRDVYEARRPALDEALAAFPALDHQVGMAVMLDGEVTGMDLISLPQAYAKLHDKLAKSYIMSALAETRRRRRSKLATLERVQAFVAAARGCEHRAFKSVGCGQDIRYAGSSITGSALVHRHEAVHMAFFKNDPDTGGGMSTLSRRRAYYQARGGNGQGEV